MNTQAEVERIRARVAEYREHHQRWLELGQRTESRTAGMADYYERQILEQRLASAWAITDVEALLAILDAQQAVIAAAGEYLSAEPGTYAQLQALDKLHDALAGLEGGEDGTQTE